MRARMHADKTLMCSHEQTGCRFRHLRDARQSCSANQPRMLDAACCIPRCSGARPLCGRAGAALCVSLSPTNILLCAISLRYVLGMCCFCAALEAHLRPASPPGTAPVTLRRARLAICHVGMPVRCAAGQSLHEYSSQCMYGRVMALALSGAAQAPRYSLTRVTCNVSVR
jgi:hypothetical protein